MYCRKCGNQLEDDALFCIKCGTKAIIEENEVISKENGTKDIVNTGVVIDNVVKEDSKPIIDTKVIIDKVTEIKGSLKGMTKKNLYIMAGIIGIILLLVIIVITRNADSNTKAYEAFKEYYNEFYYRHLDDEISTIDCGGQIVINENGEPILAICDLNLTDERPSAEVYLYEYKDEEVIEIAKATGIETEIEGLYIDVYNGKITMCTEPLGTRNVTVYVLEEYGFNTESIIKAGGLEGYNKENKYNEFWVETRRYTDTPLYIAFYSVLEDEMALNGSDFESILNGLAKVDAKTMLDVKKVYTDYFRVENINRHPEFVYVENCIVIT